jgi:hypothetical protein
MRPSGAIVDVVLQVVPTVNLFVNVHASCTLIMSLAFFDPPQLAAGMTLILPPATKYHYQVGTNSPFAPLKKA